MTLIHHDIFAIDSRYVGAVMSLHRDHDVYRRSRRRDLLACKRDIADCQHGHRENYFKSEMTFCHGILMTSLLSELSEVIPVRP